MASSTLVSDLIWSVSDALTDTSPQFVRWGESALIRWVNEAQLVIAKYLPQSCARLDSIRLSPGTKQYIGTLGSGRVIPGDGSGAAITGNCVQDVVRNMGSNGTTPGRAVRIVDRDVLDTTNPEWHSAKPASVVRQYTFDPRTPKFFYVSPPTASDVAVWVEVSYLADPLPVPVGAGLPGSAVRLSVDDRNADDVFNYVMARALMKDAEAEGNAALANGYVQMFTASINAQATVLTGVNPNLKTLPINPAIPAQAS